MPSIKSISTIFLLCVALPMSTLASPVSLVPGASGSELTPGAFSGAASHGNPAANSGPSSPNANNPSVNAEDNGNSRTTNVLSDLDIGNDIGNIVGNKILNDNLNDDEVLSENTLGDISLIGRGEDGKSVPIAWQA